MPGIRGALSNLTPLQLADSDLEKQASLGISLAMTCPVKVDKLLVMDTQLGNIIGGVIPASDQPRPILICNITLPPVNRGCGLTKFWELEEVPTKLAWMSRRQLITSRRLIAKNQMADILYLCPGDCLQ